ncbi:hypothetical protein NMNM422_1528 [Neisseria meningitidis NM422]|nr:hypothetical protein NMNM422_1528 [Neisseria meningitidis NM422]ELK82376.1 hypothetical protein NMNM418_1564 [Neisseria meningitidis NM418]
MPLTFSLAQRREFTTAPGYNCAEHIGYLYYSFFKTDSLYCLKRVSGNHRRFFILMRLFFTALTDVFFANCFDICACLFKFITQYVQW